MDPIVFNGLAVAPAPSKPDDLNAVDACSFSRLLNLWIARVWIHLPDVPSEQDELSTFDELSLISEFRRSYENGDWREMSRGSSIEEAWLGFQLSTRAGARCLMSTEFADQPSGRISRKTLLQSDTFVTSLRRWMAHPRSACHAMVRTGSGTGHSILLLGFDADSSCFRYWDPWPVRSLLCAENNTAGISAIPDTSRPGLWLVPPADLRLNLAAVLLREQTWQRWLMYDQFVTLWPAAQRLAAGQSVQEALAPREMPDDAELPPPPWQDEPEPPSPEEAAFALASKWVSARPFDAVAVATAASRFAQLLQSRGHADEAIHWYRQSAMIRQSDAVGRLITLLRQRGEPDEAEYWIRRGRDREYAELPSGDEIRRRLGDHGGTMFGPQQVADWEAAAHGSDLVLGGDLEHAADVDGAESAYRRAMAIAQSEAGALAANRLGLLLERRGDADGARAAYLHAATAEYFTASPHAWANLGRLLERTGDQAAADEADRKAVGSGHPEVAAKVALALGRNMMRARESDQARNYFEQAVFSNDADTGADAAFGLGALLISHFDDIPRAMSMFRRATASKDPQTAELAAETLQAFS